jgi:hypothetical protein
MSQLKLKRNKKQIQIIHKNMKLTSIFYSIIKTNMKSTKQQRGTIILTMQF